MLIKSLPDEPLIKFGAFIKVGNGRSGGGKCNWLPLVLCSSLIDGVIKQRGTNGCPSMVIGAGGSQRLNWTEGGGLDWKFNFSFLTGCGPNGEREGSEGGRMSIGICVNKSDQTLNE